MLRWRRGRRAAARCGKLWQATLVAVREEPYVLGVTVAVLAVLLAIGLTSVLTASAVSVRNARDLAERGLGNQVAQSLREALLIATFGSELLATVVKRQPECRTLDEQWDAISEDIMGKVDSQVVKQLELDVAGVIWKTSPPLQGRTAEILYGRDLLKEPDDRPGMLYALQERRTLFLGPYNCRDGFKCAFVVTPLFISVPSKEYDWGCGYQPYNCSELCWDPARSVKFWGQVSTMLNLDPLLTGADTHLHVLQQRGYRYTLWQAATSVSNPYFVLGGTAQLPHDPVTLRIANYNVLWYLEVAPSGGWVPPWRDPCLAAVVVGACLVSLLVLWLLVTKEQHNRLLRAMLPQTVIRQLQDGETPAAQEYDTVTVLFSDIVGYTCVASQLSPRQVVTLLNELFSVFDELTTRNGVYKVETIGDALMCVTGCPIPEDPIASAVRMANMALDMVAAVEQFRPSLEGVRGVQIRVGIHSGPVVAGVVGKTMPRYCLFGDTVNTSSRMESTSEPMKIQISAITAALLRSSGQGFELEARGPVDVKGKGIMDTHWLTSGPQQPVPRSRSFFAALQRPPSLIIRPPAPAPAKRPTPRAPTCDEPGKHSHVGLSAALPTGPLGLAPTATATAVQSPTALEEVQMSPTHPTTTCLDSYPQLRDAEQQQQQHQHQQEQRQLLQQQWLQSALQPMQPQPLSVGVGVGVNGLSEDCEAGAGRPRLHRRRSCSGQSLLPPPAAPPPPRGENPGPGASSLAAEGLQPPHDSLGGSSVDSCGGGGGGTGGGCKLPMTEYDDDDDDDEMPLDICASAMTIRTAMGMAAAAMAARGRSVSAIDLSGGLAPRSRAGRVAGATTTTGGVPPVRGAASLPCKGGGSGGSGGNSRHPFRLRSLALHLPLRRSLAQRLIETRSASMSPLPLGSRPFSGPAAAAAVAAAAATGGAQPRPHPHSLFRLVSRERSSLGSAAFTSLPGGSGACTSSEPAGGGQPLLTLTLESDKALEHTGPG